jgi:outer membrane protein assembly factor BamE (lipoprotein component of BamABCDE complex)
MAKAASLLKASLAALLAAGTLAAGACAPIYATNGFQAVDVKPTDVKVGDTRSSVLLRLGSPSTSGTFDPNVWYYITQHTEKYAYYKPRVMTRQVTVIDFDKDDKVAEVKTLGLKDGYEIAYDSRETPTRGRQLNWVEQLLGNIGKGGGMLPQDYDPGNRPGGH